MITNTSTIDYDDVLPDGTTTPNTKDSNEVSTQLVTDAITLVKSASETYLVEGQTSTQTVVITNNSEVALTGLTFTDTLSAGASYVAGSVTVNGTAESSYDPSTGFALPDIDAGDSVTVTYGITADNPLTTTPITNTASLAYTIDDPSAGPTDYTGNSNDLSLDVISTDITNVKSVNRNYANSGDTLTYTSVITNTGSVTKSNMTFTDAIPTGTTFTAGSVTVGGVSFSTYDPSTGFSLNDLDAGDSVTVVFEVTVN